MVGTSSTWEVGAAAAKEARAAKATKIELENCIVKGLVGWVEVESSIQGRFEDVD